MGESGWRPWLQAQQALEPVKLALEQGGDVNAANESGQTPMHGAATIRSVELIQLLVNQGAKVDVEDKNGQTPLDIAERAQADASNIDSAEAEAAVAAKRTFALLTKLSEHPPAQPSSPRQ